MNKNLLTDALIGQMKPIDVIMDKDKKEKKSLSLYGIPIKIRKNVPKDTVYLINENKFGFPKPVKEKKIDLIKKKYKKLSKNTYNSWHNNIKKLLTKKQKRVKLKY